MVTASSSQNMSSSDKESKMSFTEGKGSIHPSPATKARLCARPSKSSR